MSRPKTAVHAAVSTYIDPSDCDSTISYKVVTGRRLWGSVQLSDCNRKIEWYFGSTTGNSIAKIDKAIETLKDFKEEFAKQLALKPKRVVRKKRVVKKD